LQGVRAALAAGAQGVAVFGTASESFSQKNIHCSIEQSLQRFDQVVRPAQRHSIPVRGCVSCALGCPYEGEVEPSAVAQVAAALYAMGCYEICLGDTLGVGAPGATLAMIEACAARVPPEIWLRRICCTCCRPTASSVKCSGVRRALASPWRACPTAEHHRSPQYGDGTVWRRRSRRV
jgi:isopropylmalate/homocitrate/citramalate synthase